MITAAIFESHVKLSILKKKNIDWDELLRELALTEYNFEMTVTASIWSIVE